ncbi:ABC transporter permease [Streptomyces sp. NL15-2K]|uniref:ABC transporter permease n=1 Tax=Streptomyces sp. NL15-2K TaxID=376149 RepID=UPI000F57108F|nr:MULTISPECIES: ABC transporter permease subunit [Actinomycetes]WKX15175.1 ABC transporter permease subunit [Kutzneria buriramensis]GCB52267.1 transmembrane component of hydroxymethylpyrimidine ABC transporter [Streptomyces sp. NL15-2K]
MSVELSTEGGAPVPQAPGAAPPAPAAGRARPVRRPWPAWVRPGIWLPTVAALAVAGGLWTLIAAGNPYVLPRLPAVGEALVGDPELFVSNAGATLKVALLGLLLGFVAAYAVAVITSEIPVLRRAIMPLATVLQVTPVVALAPGLVVAFGFGLMPKVIVTAIITFFPVLANVSAGLRSVQLPTLHVFTTLHASRFEVLVRLRIPTAVPYTLAALRVVLPLSLVGAVVAEFVAAGSSTGLGTMIKNSAANSQLPQMYGAVGCLALIGVITLIVINAAERRLLFWHESQQGSNS